MNSNLYELISAAKKGEEQALINLIVIFEPAVNKFSRHLGYDCAKTDLNIFLIELIKRLELKKFDSKANGKIFNYIYNSLKHKKINLFNKNVKNKIDVLPIKLEYIKSYDSNIETKILVSEFWEFLTAYQQNVLQKKFFEGLSDVEIASDLNVSRQAINRCKNRAFDRIKEQFQMN
jgi:RNA polymerase sigma factor (sigma-70 family)